MKTIGLAAVAALITVPTAAKDHSWAVGSDQYHVYYRDLNVSRVADRAEMLARIDHAATKLCRERTSIPIDLKMCVDQVVAETAQRSAALRLALTERR